MGKPRYKYSFAVVGLLMLLGSCGQPQTAAPEDATSDSDAVTTAPETPAADTATEAPEPATAAETNPETANARPTPVALAKQDCGQMATQADMNQCAADNYEISDKALNEVYQEVRQGLGDTAKAQLTTAEERWIVFRDAQCAFESSRYEGGSIAPLVQASCMEQITDNRIAELQQNDQTQIGYGEADAQLNAVYQQVQSLVSEARGEALTDVQLSWLDYRDAHCAYEVSAGATADQNACLAAITETRVWQLEALADELSL